MALWYVTFSTWKTRHGLWLEDLFVLPEHRRLGLGRALLSTLAQVCLDRGYRRFEWWVLDWNEPAHGFYRSLGAVPQDEWTVWRLEGADLAATAAGGPVASARRADLGARRLRSVVGRATELPATRLIRNRHQEQDRHGPPRRLAWLVRIRVAEPGQSGPQHSEQTFSDATYSRAPDKSLWYLAVTMR